MGVEALRARRIQPYLAALGILVLLLGVAAVSGREPVARTADASDAGGASIEGFDDEVGVGGGDTVGADAIGPSTGPRDGAAGQGPAATTPGRAGARVARPGAIYDVGVTDTEIRVGGSTFTSGPAAVYGEQIAVGFAAGVNYINETGGINGRRVVLKIYDDGGDPAKQLTNTKRLIEVDKVFALAMSYAPIVGPYVTEQRVPVYHLGQHNDEFTNPWWFPVGGPQRLASFAMARYGARTIGAKSVAIFYLDAGAANYSKAYAEAVAKDWEAYGVDVPVMVGFAPDQTSCSDAIGQARNAGAEFIDFEIDASKVINCGVEAQIQNYRPPKGWGGYLIGVPVIHEALGDFSLGMYAFDAFGANYSVPAYVEAVRKVSAKTESYSSVTMSYFISALLMRDSIAALGDNITRERLQSVLNTFTDWRPGLTDDPNQPSWTWRPECHVALKGGYVIQIRKQQDGSLRWDQITPQFTTTYVPPRAPIPPDFTGCAHVFTRDDR